MNRNVESRFSSVPRLHHQRSMFDRSFSHKLTFNAGDVIPIYTQEVLPGDTVSITTSKIVRLQTLLAPVMDNIYLDTYFFYCPNRILWKHWKEFLGENSTSAWVPSVEYTVPKVSAPSGGYAPGTIADYMGFPLGVEWSATDPGAPSALPFRAYALITNEFFRDENLNLPNLIDDGDSNISGSNDYGISDFAKGGLPYRAAKYHDYFTSCLPSPQKGPDVNLANMMTGVMPVVAGPNHYVSSLVDENGVSRIVPLNYSFGNDVSTRINAYLGGLYGSGGVTPSVVSQDNSDFKTGTVYGDYWPVTSRNVWFYGTDAEHTPLQATNLWSNVVGGNLNLSVNSLRLAVLTQMYYESLARAGSRYEEQIEQFFGVTNPDGRINHPEYLGGNRIRINVHEVTNTAQTETDFLGDIGAQSATTDTHSDFVKSFTEHGWLIGVCVMRYDHTYSQGMPAQFTRTTKFDFYNPMFALIGEQPVYDREIYATPDSIRLASVFGYQEAWASYRYSPNTASGFMRPNLSGSFGHWTLGDNYASKPTLSSSWIKEDKTNLDRALAVTSSLAHQAWADFYFDAKWTRPMPMFSVPGAIGQF